MHRNSPISRNRLFSTLFSVRGIMFFIHNQSFYASITYEFPLQGIFSKVYPCFPVKNAIRLDGVFYWLKMRCRQLSHFETLFWAHSYCLLKPKKHIAAQPLFIPKALLHCHHYAAAKDTVSCSWVYMLCLTVTQPSHILL